MKRYRNTRLSTDQYLNSTIDMDDDLMLDDGEEDAVIDSVQADEIPETAEAETLVIADETQE